MGNDTSATKSEPRDEDDRERVVTRSLDSPEPPGVTGELAGPTVESPGETTRPTPRVANVRRTAGAETDEK